MNDAFSFQAGGQLARSDEVCEEPAADADDGDPEAVGAPTPESESESESEPEPEPEPVPELDDEAPIRRSHTVPVRTALRTADRSATSGALERTATVMGYELTHVGADPRSPSKLSRTASGSSGEFSPGSTTLEQSRCDLQRMAEEWDPLVEFITVRPAFLASWHAGLKDEDDDHREVLQGDDLPNLLERLGYRHDYWDAEEGCSLKIEEAINQIGPGSNSSIKPWNVDDFKRWWLEQGEAVQREMVEHAQRQRIAVDESLANSIFLDDGDDAGAVDREAVKGNTGKIISRVIDDGGGLLADLGKDLDNFHKDLRDNVGAFRTVDNFRIYSMDRGRQVTRGGIQKFQDWVKWFCGAPSRLVSWVQKRVELNDETSTADWWKIFVLQLLSHCFPPLLFWRGFRIRVRKQYADALADKAALEQMKGLRWEQLIWWLVLVSLILLRSYDRLPSFVNSEIALNVTLWAFLALVRSEKEASRDMVSRDLTPTDLGTQLLGAVDQVTNDHVLDDSSRTSSDGFPKFLSLKGKIARRRAANERLSTSEHRMHDLKAEYISKPEWDTFRAFDFRDEYEDSLGDVLSDGAEGTLREFFDEMVVSLMPYAEKEFKAEFRELAQPRPGDPANKQTPTFKEWASTKDGRYTDCLIRLRQGDVGHLRSRPSSGVGARHGFGEKSNDQTRGRDGEDLDRAEKLDKRLRECEARHEDIKQAQELLQKLAAEAVHTEQHLYGRKTVLLLTLLAVFCWWLGDDSDQTRLDGDDAVSHKLRDIKSDVLNSSSELVEPLGIGAELFTWIGYICAVVVLRMLWQLRLKPVCTWLVRTRCWRWATCRSNTMPEEELLAKVDEFFCGERGHDYRRVDDCVANVSEAAVHKLLAERMGATKAKDHKLADRIRNELQRMGVVVDDQERIWKVRGSSGATGDDPQSSDDAESRAKSGRVEFDADEESDLFPLAKFSSSRSTFPMKYKWTAEQAKQYLLGDHIDDQPSKQKSKPAKLNQKKTENDLNPLRDRCRNVLRMLKLDAKLTKQVKESVAGLDSRERVRVEQDKLKQLIDDIVPSKGRAAGGERLSDAELLGAEFDAALESSGLLPGKPLAPQDAINQAKLALATWIDLQMWCVHDEFTRHVESLKKSCRRAGYKSLVDTRQTNQSIPASLVARGIVGLSQAYAHKCVTSSLYGQRLIKIFAMLCAGSPYLHYLLLGCKEFEFSSWRQCAYSPPIPQDGSWMATDYSNASLAFNSTAENATAFVQPSQQCAALQPPFCAEVDFCAPKIEIRTCHPSTFEMFCHIIAGGVEMSLVYTIFKDILVVLERFWMAQRQMEYFSQITPWPGMRSHLRFPHYGLLPTFALSCPANIRAWNKIRIYLCSFNKEIFAREQLIVTYVFALTMIATFIKIVGIFTGSVFHVADDDPEIVDTLAIKVIILQSLSFFFVGSVLWTGMQTTRLQEHGLRHVLMLSKAQHYHRAGTLFFSSTKTVTMLVPSYATIGYLQQQIERKLGIPVAHQRIDSSCVEDPLSALRTLNPVLRRKLQAEHEKARDDLLKKKKALLKAQEAVRNRQGKQLIKAQSGVQEKSKAFGAEERSQLAWLQDMQWRYDQLATHQELEKAVEVEVTKNRVKEMGLPEDVLDYEDDLERLNWLLELMDSHRAAACDATGDAATEWTLRSSPRLDHGSRRFRLQDSPGAETKDPECIVRIRGLRATMLTQQQQIAKELKECFQSSNGTNLLREDPIIHRGNGGPFDCWATLTFVNKNEAKKVLRYGLRGWDQNSSALLPSMDGQPKSCPWHYLPLKTQERWSSWLCDPDPLTGNNGVLDLQRQTFSKRASARKGINRCKQKHLQSDGISGTQAATLLKYQIVVRDGQDIKLTKLELDDSDRKQKLDDGVLVTEFNQHSHCANDDVAWGGEGVGEDNHSWRSTLDQYKDRHGDASPRSDSSVTSQGSDVSSLSEWTESSFGTSPSTSTNPVLSSPPQLQLEPVTSDSSSVIQRDWRVGKTPARDAADVLISSSSHVYDSSERQEMWRQKEELGYMLDALADILEEERIPPNLRHLPAVEDTRPTIELPCYGPVPLTGLLFSTILSLLATGLGTTATAIYGSSKLSE